MPGGTNLASRYAKAVDERFYQESRLLPAFKAPFDFTGAETVNVYALGVAPMNNYSRSGSNRYGTPDDLARAVQAMKVSRDRSFTYVIDKGDYIQSEMVEASGESLARQIREVVVPEFDQYGLRKLSQAAKDNGNYATTAVTSSNAYTEFLNAEQFFGDHNVPIQDRYAFCSYAYANLLMQDSHFIAGGNLSQEMINKGYAGEVDGVKICKCPGFMLPVNTAFIMAHGSAAVAPRQLETYKEHQDAPGYSGVLVEGRILYDLFVFNQKINGVYFHTGIGGLKILPVFITLAQGGKYRLTVNTLPDTDGNTWAVKTAATKAALPVVTEGTAIYLTSSTDPWYGAQVVTGNELIANLTTGHKFLRIVEIDSSNMPVATSTYKIPV